MVLIMLILNLLVLSMSNVEYPRFVPDRLMLLLENNLDHLDCRKSSKLDAKVEKKIASRGLFVIRCFLCIG